MQLQNVGDDVCVLGLGVPRQAICADALIGKWKQPSHRTTAGKKPRQQLQSESFSS